MGLVNLSKKHIIETLDNGQVVEIREVNNLGDTRVVIDSKFIKYEKWEVAKLYLKELKHSAHR